MGARYIKGSRNSMSKTDKIDCFAYKRGGNGRVICIALEELNCSGCRFYKTNEQLEKQLKKCDERNQKTGAHLKYFKGPKPINQEG